MNQVEWEGKSLHDKLDYLLSVQETDSERITVLEAAVQTNDSPLPENEEHDTPEQSARRNKKRRGGT